MSTVEALTQERNQLFDDLLTGKVPKRVPINVGFSTEFAIQYAGQDLIEVQWNTPMFEEVSAKVCQDFVSDSFPVLGPNRFPLVYRLLGARNFIMTSSGVLQHPEIEGLEKEEYDEFIASPYDCLVETILPRLYPELTGNPGQKAITLAKAFKAWQDELACSRAINARLSEKYGYTSFRLRSASCEAPFDYVADQLRGFKGISNDVRRIPDKVAAAAEAATPVMVRMGTPPVQSQHGATFIPLHMAPYMREKDFANLYWPSFKKLCESLVEAGQAVYLFVEHDWMRFLDYLYELPENTQMRFEYGDPKLVKEKLGKKHIITGFYPVGLLKTGTKQQCIDKAKELVDILAPGGRYFFDFDKIPLTVDSVNVENVQAVLEYIATNTNY